MPRKREEEQTDAMREKILAAARKVIAEEGVEALSIRKITKEMGYSAGIVYHYFRNKDEILSHVLAEGFRRILASIEPLKEGLKPDEAIAESMRGYIAGALAWPEEYRQVMLSMRPEVLAAASVLDADVREKRETFRRLIGAIEDGVRQGLFAECDARVTAQCAWCSMYGLLVRIILEGVPGAEREVLIDRQITLILKGLYR